MNNAQRTAQFLFAASDALGMDAPSVDMVSDCLNTQEDNLLDEVDYALRSNGMTDAAKHIENIRRLKRLEREE